MGKINYNEEYKKVIGSLEGKPRLLLHVCCAPCLAGVLPRLHGLFDITLYYFNPNIFPKREFDKRYVEIEKYLKLTEYNAVLVRADGGESEYEARVSSYPKKEGGERCDNCSALRIEFAAAYAARHGYDYFCTTLTVSPHKNADGINKAMSLAEKNNNVRALPCDFKKEGGFQLAAAASEKYGIYRQNYCGCAPRRLVVAVTGGIASGKSEVIRILRGLGAYTISADEVSRKLTKDLTDDAGKIIAANFPEAVTGGKLDRARLRSIVFADEGKRLLLNEITHPAIMREIMREISSNDGIIAVEVPLLFESGYEGIADIILTVIADTDLRKKRAQDRDGMNAEIFASVLRSQVSDEERISRSDEVIYNDGDLSVLTKAVEELYKSLIKKMAE